MSRPQTKITSFEICFGHCFTARPLFKRIIDECKLASNACINSEADEEEEGAPGIGRGSLFRGSVAAMALRESLARGSLAGARPPYTQLPTRSSPNTMSCSPNTKSAHPILPNTTSRSPKTMFRSPNTISRSPNAMSRSWLVLGSSQIWKWRNSRTACLFECKWCGRHTARHIPFTVNISSIRKWLTKRKPRTSSMASSERRFLGTQVTTGSH